jgi:hypothetical protein
LSLGVATLAEAPDVLTAVAEIGAGVCVTEVAVLLFEVATLALAGAGEVAANTALNPIEAKAKRALRVIFFMIYPFVDEWSPIAWSEYSTGTG